MDHRKVNNVGYKKIYPMSFSGDDTFCQYCGRSASANLALHWDHVPALNVKIPEEYGIAFDVKRTLVRACSECNLLASDIPHLDYLERHLWLKARYMRRYKSVLVNSEISDRNTDNHLKESSTKPSLERLLSMLGFGIKDPDLIKSPILKVKNKPSKRIIANLLLEHLTFSPHDIDDETEDQQELDIVKTIDVQENIPSFDFFVSLVASEFEIGEQISNDIMFISWLRKYPTRAAAMDLFEEDVEKYNIDWKKLKEEVRKELDREGVVGGNIQSYKEALKIIEPMITRTMVFNETYISFPNFILLSQTLSLDLFSYRKLRSALCKDDLDVHLPFNPEKEFKNFSWDVCWLESYY